MAHRLSIIVKTKIPDGGNWARLCTNAVVWWVRRVATTTAIAGIGTTAEAQAFQGFIEGRRTDHFLGHMGREVGTKKESPRFGKLTPSKGALVLWINTGGLCKHACINGGSNNLYGYHQHQVIKQKQCKAGEGYCFHDTSDIDWEMDVDVDIYVVPPDKAIRYFNDHVDTPAKW
jgi:hypothetical protein